MIKFGIIEPIFDCEYLFKNKVFVVDDTERVFLIYSNVIHNSKNTKIKKRKQEINMVYK